MQKSFGYVKQNITTNGFLIEKDLERLVKNGLVRTNISLDSLNREKFKEITGVDGLEQVMNTIELSSKIVKLTKVNVCLNRKNFDEIHDLIEFVSTLGENVIIKFFELWKFNPADVYLSNHIDCDQIRNKILELGEIENLSSIKGNNPNVEYFLIKSKNVKCGIVAAPTDYKCGGPSCKKIRVYTTGRTCEGRKIVTGTYEEKVKAFKELIEKRSTTVVAR